MNALNVYERLTEKLAGLLIQIKRFFRLSLRFKANLHTNTTSARQDDNKTEQMSQKAFKKRKNTKAQRQIDVACTSKVRKRILKNLRAASVSKISPARARIAREILIELENRGSLANFQPKSNPIRKDNHIETIKPAIGVAGKTSRTKEFILSMLGKIKAGFASIRQRFCFGFRVNKVNQPVLPEFESN